MNLTLNCSVLIADETTLGRDWKTVFQAHLWKVLGQLLNILSSPSTFLSSLKSYTQSLPFNSTKSVLPNNVNLSNVCCIAILLLMNHSAHRGKERSGKSSNKNLLTASYILSPQAPQLITFYPISTSSLCTHTRNFFLNHLVVRGRKYVPSLLNTEVCNF